MMVTDQEAPVGSGVSTGFIPLLPHEKVNVVGAWCSTCVPEIDAKKAAQCFGYAEKDSEPHG